MDSEVGRLSKEICLKFPEEDQKAQWLKHCNNNNKDEDISRNVNTDIKTSNHLQCDISTSTNVH